MAKFVGMVPRDRQPQPIFFRRLSHTYYDPSFKGTGKGFEFDHSYESTGRSSSTFGLGARLVQALRDLENLEADWDTYGADAPKFENIQIAERVCQYFPRKLQPEIAPEPDGTIGLYWDLDYIYNLNVDHTREGNPKFSFETYDGTVLLDEEMITTNLGIDELAVAIRSYLQREMTKQ